jgi:hypothetical protein
VPSERCSIEQSIEYCVWAWCVVWRGAGREDIGHGGGVGCVGGVGGSY